MQDLNALPLPDLFTVLTKDDAFARLLSIALDEDLGPGGVPGDITTLCCIPSTRRAEAMIVAKEAGVMSGLAALPRVAAVFAPSCRCSLQASDGDRATRGQVLATLSGPMSEVLRAERTMLNLVGRLSGIATRTAAFAQAIEGTAAKLLDTRKTTPGLRALEKYAVRCGGGHLYRIGLFDAVLFKDNHLFGVAPADLPRWVEEATRKARATAELRGTRLHFVELEVDSLEQLEPVLAAGGCGVDIILLDNMDCATMRRAVAMRANFRSRVLFEASGGVTLETIRATAETGVERISVGGLTHHAVSLDVSMDVKDVGR